VDTTQLPPIDMFTSLVQIGLLVGSYLVTSVSGQVIGRKLGHPNPWLAWVPLVNLGYFMSLANRSVPQSVLLLIPFVGSVVYAIMFGDIAERLALPRWVGWSTVLPLMNVLAFAYMAVAGTGPRPSRRPVRLHALS
jgi:hypothetical protein